MQDEEQKDEIHRNESKMRKRQDKNRTNGKRNEKNIHRHTEYDFCRSVFCIEMSIILAKRENGSERENERE